MSLRWPVGDAELEMLFGSSYRAAKTVKTICEGDYNEVVRCGSIRASLRSIQRNFGGSSSSIAKSIPPRLGDPLKVVCEKSNLLVNLAALGLRLESVGKRIQHADCLPVIRKSIHKPFMG